MSFLEKLNKDKLDKNINVTIRMSIETKKTLSDIAEYYDLTISSLSVKLFETELFKEWEKIKSAQQVKNDKEIESNANKKNNYFILNTNATHSIEDSEWMKKNGFAAAFENGYKEKIKRIKKDDCVFLYESGTGIVGVGYSEGELYKTDLHNKPNDTYYVKLKDFLLLNKPLVHSKIKEIVTSINAVGTLALIKNNGDKLNKHIRNLDSKIIAK